MNSKTFLKIFTIAILQLTNADKALSCSMYKITYNGKTMVGCNHDTWLSTPRIWFETNGFGAAYTGARLDGDNGYAPQSGLNEFGLAFSRLAAPPPKYENVSSTKISITNPTLFLKEVLHKCKTVDEVKNYIDKYDHSSFSQDVFIYVDKSGKYLIVEPYKTTLGNDPKYVLANFCPSQITNFSSIKQERYINGSAFLKNKIDTSLSFCKALSDTMHVCRKKIGDGTLLTSIWNINDGIVYVYFYHDYKHVKQFNLKDELAKGDHAFELPNLFPPNEEFKKLVDYKTPLNSTTIDLFLRICLGFYLFSALFFLFNYFKKRKTTQYSYLKLFLFPFNLIMMSYMFILGTELNIYYYPTPYKSYNSGLIDVIAYTPFLLALLIIPFIIINLKLLKTNAWKFTPKWLFTINNIVCIILICLFIYWGFYNVTN